MNAGLFLYFAAPNAAYRRAAIPRLKARFPNDWAEVWSSTRDWRTRIAPSRPRHSAAVNILMRQMEWGCALYRALKDFGMEEKAAGALVEAVGLDVYEPMATAWFKISRLRSANHAARIKWLFGLMTRYFFSPPFIHEFVPAETGTAVAFNVRRCPLVDYFKDQGVPELTKHAACNLDFAAARAYGVELVRTQTIAEGADYCDFRWRLSEADQRAPEIDGELSSG